MFLFGKRRIRYAVVGLGNIAQTAVLPAFAHASENSVLAALVSSDAEKLRVLGKKYKVAATGSYDDLEHVLTAAKIDAVYVAVPNTHHRAMAERAARAGVHVLCEKPMAMTEAECEAMIEAADENRVKLMIAYRLHFEPANLSIVERVRHGEIGEPRIFSSVFCQQVRSGDIRTREKLGGGALFDMGIYCINAARYVFQDEPIEAYAIQLHGSDERSREVDETTTAVLRFPGNRVAQLTSSQGAAPVSQLRVVGTKGILQLEPAYEYSEPIEETWTIDGHTKTRTHAREDQFAPELVYFSRCILNDREPEPSGRHGLADVRIMEALHRSAESGTKVTLTPVALSVRPNASLEMKMRPVKEVHPVRAPSPST